MAETLEAAPVFGRSAAEALAAHDRRVGTAVPSAPTGFDVLDEALGGGLRPGELVLLGGQPGVGKTIAALQWARNMAVAGHHVLFVCYEHDEDDLLDRLVAMEMGELAAAGWMRASGNGHDLHAAGASHELLRQAAKRAVGVYGHNLVLVEASQRRLRLDGLTALALTDSTGTPVVVVDYMQKVGVDPAPETEVEQVRRVAETLKDVALTQNVAVLGLVAADVTGLDAPRLRLHHLRGASPLSYEADVAILMNDKLRVVSKAHLAYDLTRIDEYKRRVVFTIEKNRRGASGTDVEFTKDFGYFRFHPRGRYVAERLVDERFDDQ